MFSRLMIAVFLFLQSHQSTFAAPDTDALSRKCIALRSQTFTTADGVPSKILTSRVALFGAVKACELKGYTHTQSQFALRIPLEDWNGKLYFRGCGGFCGGISIDRANPALAKNYATVATNMGHVSTALDGIWAYNNREAEIDFAHRSTHRVAMVAKEIISAFTGRKPASSLFHGCSTGGRQALVAAERYPEDFDAIISGAPVRDYVHGSALQLLWSTLVASGHHGDYGITEDETRLLADYVMRTCDRVDGSEDGVIANPRRCNIDFTKPICNTEGICLSDKAKRTAQAIYDGPVEQLGDTALRGPEFGSELNWIGPYVGRGGNPPLYLGFMKDLFRYIAFEEDPGPDWEPDIDKFKDYQTRSETVHALISSDGEELKPYLKRGGRLLMYHGWRDQSVVPQGTLDYLETIKNHPGTQSQVRAFMVPGLNHCVSGVGPTEVDWLSVMEEWIESNEAPERVTASALKDPTSKATVSAYTVD